MCWTRLPQVLFSSNCSKQKPTRMLLQTTIPRNSEAFLVVFFWHGICFVVFKHHLHVGIWSNALIQFATTKIVGPTIHIFSSQEFQYLVLSPRCSMYGKFNYIWWIFFRVTVGKYTIHRSYASQAFFGISCKSWCRLFRALLRATCNFLGHANLSCAMIPNMAVVLNCLNGAHHHCGMHNLV